MELAAQIVAEMAADHQRAQEQAKATVLHETDQAPDPHLAQGSAVRNPRRAYNADGTEIAPMTLANMRENGVRSATAACDACKHEAVMNCDALPAELPVPDVALRLRCSGCESRKITTRPDWTERPRVV